jgi:V8-like Glu-specific endopeptidase
MVCLLIVLISIRLSDVFIAVVKVVACFSDGTATGSGVLINENIVATAAHLVMDDSGHAKSVTVRAGLGGIDNTIESRKGTYTAVHHKWFNEGSPLNDLAFIRLSKPFDTVKPISYKQTPDTDTGIAANIYGFPYDMPSFAKGNRLCVSKGLVRYSQTCSTGMVEHDGDSVEGAFNSRYCLR